jgi:hypothetical protein
MLRPYLQFLWLAHTGTWLSEYCDEVNPLNEKPCGPCQARSGSVGQRSERASYLVLQEAAMAIGVGSQTAAAMSIVVLTTENTAQRR